MHANRAKEIADNFDRVTYLAALLEKEKSAVVERILSIARDGGYYILHALEHQDLADGLVKYLEVDCGYKVARNCDDLGVFLEISWD